MNGFFRAPSSCQHTPSCILNFQTNTVSLSFSRHYFICHFFLVAQLFTGLFFGGIFNPFKSKGQRCVAFCCGLDLLKNPLKINIPQTGNLLFFLGGPELRREPCQFLLDGVNWSTIYNFLKEQFLCCFLCCFKKSQTQPDPTNPTKFLYHVSEGDGFGTFGLERGWLVEGYRWFDDPGDPGKFVPNVFGVGGWVADPKQWSCSLWG